MIVVCYKDLSLISAWTQGCYSKRIPTTFLASFLVPPSLFLTLPIGSLKSLSFFNFLITGDPMIRTLQRFSHCLWEGVWNFRYQKLSFQFLYPECLSMLIVIFSRQILHSGRTQPQIQVSTRKYFSPCKNNTICFNDTILQLSCVKKQSKYPRSFLIISTRISDFLYILMALTSYWL